jgi:hypothetical protein
LKVVAEKLDERAEKMNQEVDRFMTNYMVNWVIYNSLGGGGRAFKWNGFLTTWAPKAQAP